ncbi:MAG TPA: VOC family protein [Candidatus Galloscillospira stercoripullorum]|nr:VOC family protein [Candidatus Galloscillospira stercoripullorum]
MRISIVGMFVKDLEGAKKFFMDYFGAQEHAVYEEDNGFKSYILKFDEGPKLELMTKPEIVDQPKDPNRTGFVHICIKVDSREKLDEITEKFRAAGYEILYEPATVGGKETRAITFEGNILEVSA